MYKLLNIKSLLLLSLISTYSLTQKAHGDVFSWIYDLFYEKVLQISLYKNESYEGGSAESELKSFQIAAKKISIAQEKIAKNYTTYGEMRRVFHAKQHACLTGKLNLFTHRPYDVNNETFIGLFNTNKKASYDIILRFSNGLGIIQHDREPDVRGIAMKIFDVYSEESQKTSTVDYLMTNAPTPVAKNLNDFVSFMEHIVESGPTLGSIKYALANPEAAPALFGGAGVTPYFIKSLATIQYWSGHPYLLGQNKAMKLTLIPEEKKEERVIDLLHKGEDFLREDLANRLKQKTIKFTLAMQLEVDPINTPIENNLKEWKPEISPFIPVGELVIEKQNINVKSLNSRADKICENMSFSPANYIPEHRPLSNMGRGRIIGYHASKLGRLKDWEEIIPTVSTVNKLRKLTNAQDSN